ncbi:MAG TPA: SGNH/GDSL hydrolase family protein [Gemmatimonadaceae bacterium]|nr:SGNH/GDSL hydrolase family protein [Gemmatimonadaceae bacterium]
MMRRWAFAPAVLIAFAIAACERDVARVTGPHGSEALARYVAIGTSLSAGVQSGGLLYSTQGRSWPALLADQSFAPFTTPAIRGPGCAPPIIAPLQFGRRLSGGSLADDDTCALLFADVSLPTNNLAVPGATTQSALTATPESFGEQTFARMLHSRILPSGRSQVTAMMEAAPTLVSVELGANEVLGAVTSGLVVPNVTLVPFGTWQPLYTMVIDSVVRTGARALLATVPRVSGIVSLRTGSELWAARQQFLAFNVNLNADCDGSPNLVFTPRLVLGKVAEGQALAPHGQQAQLSCANQPPSAPDFILSPAEAQIVNDVVTQMNQHIQQLATLHGFALLDANVVLQQIIDERPAFNLITLLSCVYPFGQYVSLDGVHPNSDGYRLVANAAAAALNARYGFHLPTPPVPVLASLCS